jgi:hypothetical protein
MTKHLNEWVGLSIIPIDFGNSTNYKIKVGKQKRNPFFITNPKVREIISTKKYDMGENIGFVNIEVREDTLHIRKFHPIGWGETQAKTHGFLNTSTAALIETRILKDIQKKFPNVKYIQHNPSWLREEQLKKRAISVLEMSKRMSFEKTNLNLRNKLARDLRVHKKK